MSKEIANLIKGLTSEDTDKAKHFYFSLSEFFDRYDENNAEKIGLSRTDVENYEAVVAGIDDSIIIAAMYLKYCLLSKEV